MDTPIPLTTAELYRACPAEQLPFETSAELSADAVLFGQKRALDAISFGLAMPLDGHNLFVMGPPGTGRRSFLREHLTIAASARPAPSDWCYVNDFEHRDRPVALELPAGAGPRLAAQIERFVDEVQAAVGAAFNNDEYRNRRQAIDAEFQEQQGEAFERIQAAARARSIRIMQAPNGMVFAPVENDEVVGPDEFEKLAPERKAEIQAAAAEIGQLFQDSMREMPERLRLSRERVHELDRQVAEFAIDQLVREVQKSWQALPAVASWLETLHADLARHYEILRPREPADAEGALQVDVEGDEPNGSHAQRRYGVNVLVTHNPHGGAPVVFEERPAYGRLLGKIEHRAHFGALLTDFNLIRAGALHNANGGYLVLNGERLVAEPYAWDALKQSLRTSAVNLEPLDQIYGVMSTTSLEPAPIPLKLKIVLFGSPRLYYQLSQLDPEFEDYFKVVAEFDDRTERSPEVVLRFAGLLAAIVREDKLLPLQRGAVARIIEEAARDCEDAERLSTEIRRSADLLREACHWAKQRKDTLVRRADVEKAIAQKAYRKGRVRERTLEEIQRETLFIATEGERIGQINGLSVLALGDQVFGRPSRITATVSLGSGRIVDIEREAELGGALHTKGVMILAGYIASRYAQNIPPSFAATLAFEQSYGGIDGDSASSTELYALLSALAEVPIRQCYAVTGSVNQFGEVQAIGGVNHKIEAYFDVCDARGLSGEQGVLIPTANVKHLMLRQRVIDAVATGKFHIYPVAHIEQGLRILTGIETGSPSVAGIFPAGSLNRRISDRLRDFAEQRRRYANDDNVDKKT